MIPLWMRYMMVVLALIIALIQPVDWLSVAIGFASGVLLVLTVHESIIKQTGQCPEFRWLPRGRIKWLS